MHHQVFRSGKVLAVGLGWKSLGAQKWSFPLYTCIRRRSTTPLKWSYLMGPGDTPLVGLTIGGTIDRAADLFGDNEALVSCHQNIRKNFSQIKTESDQLASGLLDLGFKRGDGLGIWGPNSYEWYLTEFAAAKAGLILVNINPAYRPNELKYCLNKVSVKGIICAEKFKTSNYYNLLTEIVPELPKCAPTELKSKEVPSLTTVITMSETPLRGTLSFRDVFEAGLGRDAREKLDTLTPNLQFDDVCNIQFTSGTTGFPKGVLLSHHNMVNNVVFVGKRCGYEKKPLRICVTVPLYHCFGCVVGVLGGALYGCTSVFPSEGFDAKAAVQAFEHEKINSVYGTPTMFVDIFREFQHNPVDVSSLHGGMMSGAPCPEELLKSLMNELGMREMIVTYGLTETSPVAFQCFPNDSVELRTKTVGYPVDHTEAKVVDETGKIVRIGEPGELLVRGYCNFLGYWEDEAKTAETIGRDRWLKTGDLVSMNEQGYASIIGRIKDMVIRGGENIYPAEVENFYMSHPDVVEAQAFGVPDERMGEEVAMWVRLMKGSDFDVDSLKEWSKGKIAHYKVPKYILAKSEFPVTITGKVQKFKMREQTIQQLRLTNLT